MIKYYKKVTTIKNFVQPTLTANGTLGGDEFAVDAVCYPSNFCAWCAFDGNESGGNPFCTGKYNHLTIYSPTPINITNIRSVGVHTTSWAMTSYKISASHDNINYVDITGTLKATNYEVNANININEQYKYWRITPITLYNANYGWSMCEVYITAYTKITTLTEVDKAEYDTLADNERMIVTDIYKAPVINNKVCCNKRIVGYTNQSITFNPNNINVIGDVIIDNKGVATNLSTSNYITMPAEITAPNNSMQWVMTFRIGENQNGGAILGGVGSFVSDGHSSSKYNRQYMYLSATKSKVNFTLCRDSIWGNYNNPFDVYNGVANVTLQANKWYSAKIVYQAPSIWKFYVTNDDGAYVEYTTTAGARGQQLNDYSMITTRDQRIGGDWYGTENAFDGEIDLLNSYVMLDNSLFWTNKKIVKAGKPIITYNLGGGKLEVEKVIKEIPFIQPTLTANGTLGGDKFAVKASGEYSSCPAWKAFDNDLSTYWLTVSNTPDYIIYNPKSIQITDLEITNTIHNNYYIITAGNVLASNDNSNWQHLVTFTNSVKSANGVWSINLNNNNYYKYYKISVTGHYNANGGSGVGIGALKIISNSTILTWQKIQ